MVTAVQPMFGLLKRLHLHPMENALNEISPQTSLLQSIKFVSFICSSAISVESPAISVS